MSEGAAGNPTVAMIEAAFAHHGLHWRYVNMEVPPADLAAAVLGAKAMGFRGFNCSLPHKVTVIPHLDGLGQSAEAMGAVNCVVRREDRFIGENTDGKGFLRSLQTLEDPRGKSVVLYGAGGAARAVAVELALAGASHITVVNRSESRGTELLELLRSRLKTESSLELWRGRHAVPSGTDIVINATSIGLYDPDTLLPIDLSSLRPGVVVADVVFNPVQTRFLNEAASRGCRTLDGLGMLVNQGILGIQYWTGVTPDAGVMRAALEKTMGV
jgi:shikimate dehydrogenase